MAMATWIWSNMRGSFLNLDQFVEIDVRELTIYGRMPDGSEVDLYVAEASNTLVAKLAEIAEKLGVATPTDGDLAEVANEIEAKQKTMPIKPQMYGINRT
jgi:hypothetical protein